MPAEFSSAPAVDVRDLSKQFHGRYVLRGVNLQVAPGETIVLFGPNGAGKTTLLRILATLIRPSSGTVRIAGQDARQLEAGVRRRIGVLAHQTYLYDDLSADENLRFYGRMFDVADLDARISEVLGLVDLVGRRRDQVRVFSRGMQQRLALARAILHRPSLLLLDEPESGLDPQATAGLRDLFARVDQPDRAVILTSHDLALGLDLADRVIILVEGRVAFDRPRGELDYASVEAAYQEAVGLTRTKGFARAR